VRNNPLGMADLDGHGWWGDFFSGVADTTYRPVVQAVSHPIDTAVALGHAAAHPIDTAVAVKNAVVATAQGVASGDPKAIGQVTGTVVSALVTAGAAKVASAAVEGAEVGSAASDAALASRAAEIHGALDPIAQSMRTTAVASVTDAKGASSVLVGSSNTTLAPAQRAVLGAGETAVRGAGHAEVTVVNAAKAQGMSVDAVAASRPICPTCQQVIKDAGGRAVNPQ
jgi:hypothetical protein